VGHVACTEDMRGAKRVLVEGPDGDHVGDLGIFGRIINWIFKTLDEEAWSGLLWLRIGTGGFVNAVTKLRVS